MIEISKELLSEVLNYYVDKYTIVSSVEITQIRIFKKDAEMWDYRSYDIHHLAHKCKEWALSKEYVISSHSKYKLDGYNCILYCNNGEIDEDFTSNTEVEAIIKACEWVLRS